MASYLMRGARSDTGEWVTWTAEDAPDLTGADYPDGGDSVITDASITVVRRIDGGGAVADGAVTEAKLADEAVSGAKLKTSDAAALRTALGLGDAAVRSTGIGGAQVVLGNDTRLSDPRTPSSHTHTPAEAGAAAAIATGTYAARPASPAVGDRYLVTSGVRKGSLYQCTCAGVWSLSDIVLPDGLSSSCVALFDGEDLLAYPTGHGIMRWKNRSPLADGSTMDLVGRTDSGGAAVTAAGALSAGLPCATNGAGQTLYAFIPGPASGADRTLAVLASYSAPVADNYNHLVAWGYPATSQMYSICVKTTLFPAGTAYSAIGNHYYSAQYTTGYSTTSGGSTPARITARYSSGSDRFYRNGVQIGTDNVVGITHSGLASSFLTLFALAGSGTSEPPAAGAKLYVVAAWRRALSTDEVATWDAWLAERHGS